MLKLIALLFMLIVPSCLHPTSLYAQASHSRVNGLRPIDLTQAKAVEGKWIATGTNVALSGRIFDHVSSLSVSNGHSDRIVFDNQKHYDVFEGWVGLHGKGAKGTITFIVMGDGHELFNSAEMHPSDSPTRISVSIRGYRGVSLVATASEDADNDSENYYHDLDCWADPIFRMGKLDKAPSNATNTPVASTASGTTDDTTSEAAPVKNKILQISPVRMDELATKLKVALAKDSTFANSRPTLAIATFKLIPANALDPTNADNVREDLSTAIINTNTFNVVERGQLDQALKELKIGLNDTFDSATAQKLGKLVSAQVVLIGSVSDRGNFVVINARLIDTATGRARAAANVEVR